MSDESVYWLSKTMTTCSECKGAIDTATLSNGQVHRISSHMGGCSKLTEEVKPEAQDHWRPGDAHKGYLR